MVKFVFLLETKKTTFFAEIFKIQGALASLPTPSDAHSRDINKLVSFIRTIDENFSDKATLRSSTSGQPKVQISILLLCLVFNEYGGSIMCPSIVTDGARAMAGNKARLGGLNGVKLPNIPLLCVLCWKNYAQNFANEWHVYAAT